MPGTLEFEGRQDWSGPNPVTIGFSFRREACVKILGDVSTTKNADGRRQHAIEGANPAGSGESPVRQIDMSALRESVHASVGATGAVNANVRAADPSDRALEFVLNCVAMSLTLPPREGGSVISDD